MPPKSSSSEPPKVMTWPKAAPILILGLVFDAFRLFCEFFWLLGPALASVFCTIGINNAIGTTLVSIAGAVVAGACTGLVASLAVAGSFAGMIEILSVVMAMSVGFAGWLVIGGLLTATNARIFKENVVWFVASLAISEVPFVGAIPALTLTLWKMYSNQIKIEKAAYKKWEGEQAAALREQQAQQAARIAQIQEAQRMRLMQQEAATETA